MNSDDDIPVLTDLIEEEISISLPELGLDLDQDLYIEEDDPPINMHIEPDTQPVEQTTPAITEIDPKLEQTIRRILDEHLELAWQEIRLAIQTSHDDSI